MELKVKKLETKFQEENLKLQQEHDHMVKKVESNGFALIFT